VDWDDIRQHLKGDQSARRGYHRTAFPAGPQAFQSIISDRSNEPVLNPGDSVVIDPETIPEPGDYCLAIVKNSAVLRIYRPRADHIELAPTNPDWTTVQVPVDSDAIVGTMTESTRPRRR
jgi:SOS-response transcriptional repressor LexA